MTFPRAAVLLLLCLQGCKSPTRTVVVPTPTLLARQRTFLLSEPKSSTITIDATIPISGEVILWKSPDLKHWVGWFGHLPFTEPATNAAMFYMVAPFEPTRSVTLAWDRSPDSIVAGYNIYVGPATRTYTNIVSVGNVTNATVNGLIQRGKYFFSATAYDGTGLESDFSNEVSYQVPTNSTIVLTISR